MNPVNNNFTWSLILAWRLIIKGIFAICWMLIDNKIIYVTWLEKSIYFNMGYNCFAILLKMFNLCVNIMKYSNCLQTAIWKCQKFSHGKKLWAAICLGTSPEQYWIGPGDSWPPREELICNYIWNKMESSLCHHG